MKQVVFARFGARSSAETALMEVRHELPDRTDVRFFLHDAVADAGRLAESIQHAHNLVETDARHGVRVGVATGLVLGGVLGVAAAALLAVPDADLLVGGAFGAFAGILMGGLMSGLFGSGLTDRRLRRLADGLGADEVMVTLEARNRELERRCEDILRRHGGRLARKSGRQVPA